MALVAKREALIEDCARAAVLVTPLAAPQGCAAPIVIDRRKLAETGALTLRFDGEKIAWTTARAKDEDRPWSRAPPLRKKAVFADEKPREERRAGDDGVEAE